MEAVETLAPPGFVRDVLAFVQEQGLSAAHVLAAAGITLPILVATPLTVRQHALLWRAASAAVGDEAFGVGARAMRPGSFDMLCTCVLHSRSLGQALRRALQFLNLVLDDPTARLFVEGGIARVLLEDAGKPRTAFAYRAYWVMVHGVLCWLVGRRIPLRAVEFSVAASPGRQDDRLFFGTPIRFGQPRGQLAFDGRLLQLPIIRSDRALAHFLRRAPENILEGYHQDPGTAHTVRQHLQASRLEEWPGFDTLADRLRLTVTTLRRRLREEGQSVRTIKDELRRDMAVRLLAGSTLSVAAVSVELGYREPSAFYRAFRAWMACSPAAYRRAARGEAMPRPCPGAVEGGSSDPDLA